jgi:L-ascorbate metabolism protein UlaG (beta-lactamase superfamily)
MTLKKNWSLLALFTLQGCSAYQGEITDHFNGSAFFNPSQDYKKKGFSDFLSWRFNREEPKTDWVYREVQKIDRLPAPKDKTSVTFINHSSTVIQMHGVTVVTDPIWSERASPVSFAGPKRYHAPPISLEGLGWVDVVIISHNHYDHLDLPTLIELERLYSPLFLVPLGNGSLLQGEGIVRVQELDWWQTQVYKNVEITLTPAQHWSKRSLWNDNQMLWGSYFIQAGEDSVYFAGDTGYSDHFEKIHKQFGAPMLALLPIGAYQPEWFMQDNHIGPSMLPQIKDDLKAKKVMTIHFGTFALGDDGQDEPVEELLKITQTRQDRQDYIVPKPGMTLDL